ncbi:hypothetical protein AYK26_00725 [Euryarchaeota archaeon SM23-78]|nr:MAG: hypothetical protein AYK26_00725 [Euryarchaeota archaeon SM23-78]
MVKRGTGFRKKEALKEVNEYEGPVRRFQSSCCYSGDGYLVDSTAGTSRALTSKENNSVKSLTININKNINRRLL